MARGQSPVTGPASDGRSSIDDDLEHVLAKWPKARQEAAATLIAQYGQPGDCSHVRLIWYGTSDGWARTVLSREETPRQYSAPHTGGLEQFITYKVPFSMLSQLAEYGGCVTADYAKGELSARCGNTPMNCATLNLAHEIITGTRTVNNARDEYARLSLAVSRGEKPPCTRGFQFI